MDQLQRLGAAAGRNGGGLTRKGIPIDLRRATAPHVANASQMCFHSFLLIMADIMFWPTPYSLANDNWRCALFLRSNTYFARISRTLASVSLAKGCFSPNK